MRSLLIALALTVATVGGAGAETFQTPQARNLDLGPVKGIAYYTAEADGYHLVATLADETSTPVRFIATLADGQKVTISTPGAAHEAGSVIDIVRSGDRLSINPAATPTN